MNRRPVYFYFRSSWKRRRWHPIRFKRMLTPYEVVLIEYIEKLLKPKNASFGDWARGTMARLIYQAAVINNISNSQGVGPHIVHKLKFSKRSARRPGHAFYVPIGSTLKRKIEVTLA